MSTVEDKIRKFKKLAEARLKGRVSLITVFGSQIEGRVTPLSDVDVAVFPKPGEDIVSLSVDLVSLASEAFKISEDKIDILFLDDDLPIELLFKAVAKGALVYCEDREFYVDYRLRIMSEYLDFQVFKRKLKLFESYIKSVKKRLSHG